MIGCSLFCKQITMVVSYISSTCTILRLTRIPNPTICAITRSGNHLCPSNLNIHTIATYWKWAMYIPWEKLPMDQALKCSNHSLLSPTKRNKKKIRKKERKRDRERDSFLMQVDSIIEYLLQSRVTMWPTSWKERVYYRRAPARQSWILIRYL